MVCGRQAVQVHCREVAKDAKVEVQSLDITAPYAELQAAAALSDGAFGGAGIDYLVHNAGAPTSAHLCGLAGMHVFRTCVHLLPRACTGDFRGLQEYILWDKHKTGLIT